MSMNRVVLVGRLTKDPEHKITPSGVSVASFSLAVNRPFAKDDSEVKADFPNCIAWRAQADNLVNFQKKGNLIGVDGRLQTRKYQNKEGKTVWVTEVVAESIQFLEPKKDGQQGDGQRHPSQGQRQTTPHGRQGGNHDENFPGSGSIDITDDDLPF